VVLRKGQQTAHPSGRVLRMNGALAARFCMAAQQNSGCCEEFSDTLIFSRKMGSSNSVSSVSVGCFSPTSGNEPEIYMHP
jgi:hypothetical protein